MKFPRDAATIAALSLAMIAVGSAHGDVTYLSLGDSLAFGYDPSNSSTTAPSYGDQGFVKPFADYLASVYGGVRPNVLNHGIVGEQTSSFLNPASYDSYGPPRVWQLNQNYPNGTTAQNALMLSSVAGIHGAGGQVGFVSLVLGGNDLFALTNNPAFLGGTPAEQQTMLGQAMNTAFTNYGTVLTELKMYAPEARVVLPGYYNPFPAAQMPAEHAFYDLVLGQFNAILQGMAGQFGATYVDTYSLFAGNELQMTNMMTGDYHPNQAGYDAIAGAMVRSVPEPSSVVALVIGLATSGAGLLASRRFAA